MLPKLFLLFSLVLSLAVAHSEHSVVSPDTVKRLEDSLARRRLKTRKCDSSIAAFTAGRKAKRNGGAETVGVVKKRWNPTYDSIQNTTCILSTDGEQGPYWVPGELYLQNLTENQPGVKILMDIGVMDVNTCEPAENLLVGASLSDVGKPPQNYHPFVVARYLECERDGRVFRNGCRRHARRNLAAGSLSDELGWPRGVPDGLPWILRRQVQPPPRASARELDRGSQRNGVHRRGFNPHRAALLADGHEPLLEEQRLSVHSRHEQLYH